MNDQNKKAPPAKSKGPNIRKKTGPDLAGVSGKRESGKRNEELTALLALGEVENVSLDLVDRDEDQPRPLEEVMDGIEAFAEELERDDYELAQYPVYHIQPSGRYKIVVGERRTTAFRIKGKTHIPAICKRFTEDERKRIFILQYNENDEDKKKPLSPLANARWWQSFKDSYCGGNMSVAAKERGKSVTEVSNILSLLKAPDYILDFTQKYKIKDSATYAAMIRLEAAAGESAVRRVIEDYETGEITGTLRRYTENLAKDAKAIKKAPKNGNDVQPSEDPKPGNESVTNSDSPQDRSKQPSPSLSPKQAGDDSLQKVINEAKKNLDRASEKAIKIGTHPKSEESLTDVINHITSAITALEEAKQHYTSLRVLGCTE